MPAINDKRPLSVSELTRSIKRLLEVEVGRVQVEGEISNWTVARSGHAYFSLKDANAQIGCVMWSRGLERLKFMPGEGMQVEIVGDVSVYAPRGQYQIVVASMSEAGLGALYRRFLELKDQLEKEGLFDPDLKKPIPALPARVGIVTSPTSAAIRDVLNVIGRRFSGLEVFIWPALVQGRGAAEQIAHGVERFNQLGGVDVIIVCRGGGSIEDLWAFNEEVVARAIAASEIPVISGVGHETDFTIADFVADLRAPTPSAAAELVARSRREFVEKVDGLNERLRLAFRGRLESTRLRLRGALSSYGMRQPVDRLRQAQQRADELVGRIDRAMAARLRDSHGALSLLTGTLEALNPRAILSRGYSIVTRERDDQIIRRASEVDRLEKIRVLTSEGDFPATVTTPLATEQPELF